MLAAERAVRGDRRLGADATRRGRRAGLAAAFGVAADRRRGHLRLGPEGRPPAEDLPGADGAARRAAVLKRAEVVPDDRHLARLAAAAPLADRDPRRLVPLVAAVTASVELEPVAEGGALVGRTDQINGQRVPVGRSLRRRRLANERDVDVARVRVDHVARRIGRINEARRRVVDGQDRVADRRGPVLVLGRAVPLVGVLGADHGAVGGVVLQDQLARGVAVVLQREQVEGAVAGKGNTGVVDGRVGIGVVPSAGVVAPTRHAQP